MRRGHVELRHYPWYARVLCGSFISLFLMFHGYMPGKGDHFVIWIHTCLFSAMREFHKLILTKTPFLCLQTPSLGVNIKFELVCRVALSLLTSLLCSCLASFRLYVELTNAGSRRVSIVKKEVTWDFSKLN